MKIVMFSQTTCGPCRQLKPFLQAAAQQLGYDVEIIELDNLENGDSYVLAYDIEYTPTVVIFDDEDVVIAKLETTDSRKRPPHALAIKAELEQYV